MASPIYDKSVFKKFFNVDDANVLAWRDNVLNKLQGYGITPFYVDKESEDFEDVWQSVSQIFAIIQYYAKQFEDITANSELLELFLREFFQNFDVTDATTEVPLIFADFLGQFQDRGTLEIFERSSGVGVLNGELLRLIHNSVWDEFLFALVQAHEVGWTLGLSSPMYASCYRIMNLTKAYEYGVGALDLSKYPLINDSVISLVSEYITISDGLSVATNPLVVFVGGLAPLMTTTTTGPGQFIFGAGGVGYAGIGTEGPVRKPIVIDPSLDYEVSFRIIQNDIVSNDWSFGLRCYDISSVEIGSLSVKSGIELRWFIENFSSGTADNEYWVRGVIYGMDTAFLPDNKLNIGYGENLKFKSECNQVVPMIIVNNAGSMGAGDTVKIRDFKFKPRRLNHSLGMLGARGLIEGFIENNSIHTDDRATEIIEHKLIPYNSFTKIQYI